MTVAELNSRYGIKLPHELGKPLFIQDLDVKKDFWSMLVASSIALVLSLVVAALSIVMYYWIFSQDFPEDIIAAVDLSKGIISAIVLSVGWYMIFHSLRNFMVFELIVVGDKGIIRYFLNRKGKMRRNEMLLFSHAQILERYEGPVDPFTR